MCVLDVINDGTGTQAEGNYRVEAQGLGEDGGWDAWADWPKYLKAVDRRAGYEHLSAVAMQLLI